ncbi:MAG: hypothetical protein HY704_08830 [Gemmatimonadetes bacterium]|nr:hypothetical protein [Gemmatimonadota bacterium]
MGVHGWIRWSAALAAALAVAACANDSTAPAPESPATETIDLAALGAELGLPGLVAEHTARAAGGRGDCTYNQSTGWFECPPLTRNGLTINRSFALYDGKGNPQSKYDAVTTASTRIRTSVNGKTLTRDNTGSMTVNRSGDMTISGMEGEETRRTHNGTEGGTVVTEGTRNGVKIRSTSTVADATSNVVIPLRNSGNKWPLSGTVTHSGTTTVTREDTGESRTFTQRRVTTYNGSNLVPVEITRNGTTRSCTLDLEARKLSCS